MRIRAMLNFMRGHYTLIYLHIYNICARVCTLIKTIFAELTTIFTEMLKASHNNQTSIFAFTFKFKYLHIHNKCVRLQCKYCAGVLCCYMLYTVQCTLNSLYIYICIVYIVYVIYNIYINFDGQNL